MIDIKERLRFQGRFGGEDNTQQAARKAKERYEAADHIELQDAEITRLRKDAEEIHKNMLQAITDPENQPSQYGTVPMTMYEEVVDKYAALADKCASRCIDTSTQEVG